MTNMLPRVAAVHDVSGYGKCALTVAMPILSAAGVEVCPLPTALLSTNTLFENFTFFDFTPYMDAYVDHWQSLKLKFDCVYSGFLGSVKQIAVVTRLAQEFDSGIAVIDPVMGDNGNVIKTYTPEMCREMAKLVGISHLTTPNITEACILTGRTYQGEELSREDCQKICGEIRELGAQSVVLTGVQRNGVLYNCGLSAQTGYFEKEIDLLPFHMHGTGDVFTSVLVGGLVRGYDLPQSVESAAAFVYDAMTASRDLPDVFDRGVGFELIAHKLGTGIYRR